MSRLHASNIKAQDSPSVDAFFRWRVSNPVTIFNGKQLFDNQPLFWEEDGDAEGGMSTAHSADTASTVITSTVNTAGELTRRTFMRFNYQPGKSQLVLMTGIIDRSGGGTGTTRRIGLFDDDNGIFFEDDEGTIKVTRRTHVTGSAVDTKVTQASWSEDVMDGSGKSKVTIDWTKTQLFFMDFEWLGTGRIRMGLFIDGIPIVVHEFEGANVLDKVIMSTPNLPLTYQVTNLDTSAAATMECMCATVITEGGDEDLGILRYKSTSGAHVDCAAENTAYAILGVRLKAAYLGTTIKLVSMSLAEHVGSKFYEWFLVLNPTLGTVLSYGDQTNSAVQTAVGATVNTVTGGTQMGGGFASSAQKGGEQVSEELKNALRLGVDKDGNVDEIVLAVRPVGGSTNIDIEGGWTWRELS